MGIECVLSWDRNHDFVCRNGPMQAVGGPCMHGDGPEAVIWFKRVIATAQFCMPVINGNLTKFWKSTRFVRFVFGIG